MATFCFVAFGWPHLFVALGFDFDVSSKASRPLCPRIFPLGLLGASDVAHPLHYHLPRMCRDVPSYWYDARMAIVECLHRGDGRGKL